MEVNEIKQRNNILHKTKVKFFEKINTIDKPLAKLVRNKREKTKMNKHGNEKGDKTYNRDFKNS